MRLSRGARTAVTAVFLAVAFAYLGAMVFREIDTLRNYPWELHTGQLVGSIAAHVAVLLWGVWVWKLVLLHFGTPVNYRALARIWFLSGLGRYIPGKVWQFVGVAHLGGQVGLSPVVIISALAVQMGFSLIAAALVSVYFLPLSLGKLGGVPFAALRWVAPAAVLAVHPWVISRALAAVSRVTRRPTLPWNAGWLWGIWLLVLSIAGWLAYGVALMLFFDALVPIPWSSVPEVTGMNAFAFLVGYLTFLAPAGLGAKEGVLAALLSELLLPGSVAALLAVAARIWTVAAELLPALVLLRKGAPDGSEERVR